MNIKLHPAIAKLLKDREDPEGFVNSLLLSYLDKRLMPLSQAAGVVHVERAYRRSHFVCQEAFDASTHQFQGMVVTGQHPSESIFVPSQELHDLLQDNCMLLVVHHPRDQEIAIEAQTSATFEPMAKELMA